MDAEHGQKAVPGTDREYNIYHKVNRMQSRLMCIDDVWVIYKSPKNALSK